MRNTYKILVGKPEGRRSFERPRCRWEDNMIVSFGVIGVEPFRWITTALGRVRHSLFLISLEKDWLVLM
jgi:hypothetical protein